MLDVRKEFGLGGILESGEITGIDDPMGIEAKFNIAAVLDIPVNCVSAFATWRAGGIRWRPKGSRGSASGPAGAGGRPAPRERPGPP